MRTRGYKLQSTYCVKSARATYRAQDRVGWVAPIRSARYTLMGVCTYGGSGPVAPLPKYPLFLRRGVAVEEEI